MDRALTFDWAFTAVTLAPPQIDKDALDRQVQEKQTALAKEKDRDL